MFSSILQFCPIDASHAAEMLSWRYLPPYDLYNAASPVTEIAIKEILRPEFHYVAVLDERDEMIAFRCFGADAQVLGGNYSDQALDLGGGFNLRAKKVCERLGYKSVSAFARPSDGLRFEIML